MSVNLNSQSFFYSVVEVNFESSSHTFNEGQMQSSDINLHLSSPIAQSFSVLVSGGKGIFGATHFLSLKCYVLQF